MSTSDIKSLTANIVTSFVGKNNVAPDEVAEMIRSIAAALEAIGGETSETEILTPAVDVEQAVGPDAVVCLDCGRKMKSLKQHLRIYHGLTPDAYRKRWGLSAEMPIVAPRYSARRKQIALDHQLGRTKVGQ